MERNNGEVERRIRVLSGAFTSNTKEFSAKSILHSYNKVALVVGAGDGIGAAVSRKFAKEGFIACLARRKGDQLASVVAAIKAAGGQAHGFSLDARNEEQVIALIEKIESEIGGIEVCIFNIGANVRFGIHDTSSRVYSKVWEMACFAGFLTGREVTRRMLSRGKGTMLFTGATASTRGGVGFCAFAGAKAALRALAQSMARELAPKGIHIVHVIVDGPVDGAFVRSLAPEVAERHHVEFPTLISPSSVAESYYMLHCQHKSAWTFELDLRPQMEIW